MPMQPMESRDCERCSSREIAEIIYGLVTPDVEADYPDGADPPFRQTSVIGGTLHG
jgi:hypothetical protein